MLTLVAIFTSCSDDDDSSSTDEGPSSNAIELNGQVTEDMMLDASEEYQLTGVFSVESGATLTIPAGTTINTNTGTDVYIVVQMGADIVIDGDPDAPVIMSPND